MEKIKRLLEEMERNKRSRRGNRYDKEDRYTPGIYRRRMGFRRDDEDDEDEDREFENRNSKHLDMFAEAIIQTNDIVKKKTIEAKQIKKG